MDKLRELEQRRLRIGRAINAPSEKIKKMDFFVQHLAGASLVQPYIIPYKAEQRVADHHMSDELVVKTHRLEKGAPKGTYIYIRTAKWDGEVQEIKLFESPVETRLRVLPHLEGYAEYLVSQLEQKFDIDTDHDYYQQSPIGNKPIRSCHIGNENYHCCDDASDCRYAQPDGPDDYIHECECYFEGQE